MGEILAEEGIEEGKYLTEDDVEENDKPIDRKEVNDYIKMKNGRYRNKQVKFSLTETEYTLFKEKIARENTTIQKKLLDYVIKYILE